MRLYLLIGLIAATVSFGISLVVWLLSRRYRLAPAIRDRDVHTVPTPRLGGIAMFLGLLAAFAVASQIPFFHLVFENPLRVWAILGAAALIVAVGVLDDLLDLDWMIKLGAQILAGGLLALQGVQILSLPFGNVIIVGSQLGSLLLTIFLVVLVMNAINFIDGLDGLVAGVAIIGNGVFFLYSYLLAQQQSSTNYFNLASLIAITVVGICAGFLPLNWHRAKLFMGDSGALLVGLLMAVSTITVTGQINPGPADRSILVAAYIPIVLPFAVLLVPLADFALAVVRRVRSGKSPFSADRKHLHHRLLDMGHSHLHAVLIFYAWTAVVSIGCLLFFILQDWPIPVAFVVVGLAAALWYTLMPLSRRKKTEIVVQQADAGSLEARVLAAYDPLDAASAAREDDAPATQADPHRTAEDAPDHETPRRGRQDA